ncbi:putative ATPase/DNA-binding winged helix-turn-helix (wHTH) protein [Bradyrhizobium japonicum]
MRVGCRSTSSSNWGDVLGQTSVVPSDARYGDANQDGAAMVGREASGTTEIVMFGPFRLSLAERSLMRGDTVIAVGGRALDILFALIEQAGHVVGKRDLINRVWPDSIAEEANLRVHIANLRKVIGDSQNGARYIANVPGRGYCFVAPVRRIEVTQNDSRQTSGAGASPRLRLPTRPHIIGREETVAALSEMLASRRFVSIVGPGGMGKTTVALAVAHAMRDSFDGAVCFIDFGALTDAALVVPTVASGVGCFVQAPDPTLGLLAFLADKRLCLVLDNCEHVIDATAELAARLFEEAPLVHLLTTTREALRVAGENVHFLLPLEGPPDKVHASVAEVLAAPAAQLFLHRAAAGGHRVELTSADAQLVADICHRLDGIALAIEIAASRVGAYGVRGISDLLDSPFKLLWQGQRNAIPRHKTLLAMLNWSYDLLSQDEQKVLRALSVFSGVFTVEAAQYLMEDDRGALATAEALASLVDKSLVSIVSFDGQTYYRVLDTTRAYASAKLLASGEERDVAKRHALYYMSFLATLNADRAADQSAGVYIGNVRAALAWSVSPHGDACIGVELAASAAPLFLRVSLLDECQSWCRCALALLVVGARGTLQELALQKALAVSLMFTRGNTLEVRETIERGLSVAESLGDIEYQLHFLTGLNLFLTRRGDFIAALTVAKRNAAVAAGGGAASVARAEWMLGATTHMVGDQVAARRHCERGFELATILDATSVNYFGYDHRVRARVALARTLWLRGFPEQAIKAARQAIDEGAMSDHPVTLCISLLYVTYVFFWCGDLKTAEQLLERALAHTLKHSLPTYHAVGFAMKGELMVLSGSWADGVELLRTAVPALLADDHHVVATAASRALAEGLARCGKSDEAQAVIAEAVARTEQVGGTFELPDLLRAQGEILLANCQSEIEAAEDPLVRSLDLARRQSALGWELRSSIALARLFIARGSPSRARAVLIGAYEQFTEGYETTDLRTARALIDQLTSLSEDSRTESSTVDVLGRGNIDGTFYSG